MTFAGDVLDVTGVPEDEGDAAFHSSAVGGALCSHRRRMMPPASPNFRDDSSLGWCSRNRRSRPWVPFGIQVTSRLNPGWSAEPRSLLKAGLALLLEWLIFVVKTGNSGGGSGFVLDEVSSVGPPLPESPSESEGFLALSPTMFGRDPASSFPGEEQDVKGWGGFLFERHLPLCREEGLRSRQCVYSGVDEGTAVSQPCYLGPLAVPWRGGYVWGVGLCSHTSQAASQAVHRVVRSPAVLAGWLWSLAGLLVVSGCRLGVCCVGWLAAWSLAVLSVSLYRKLRCCWLKAATRGSGSRLIVCVARCVAGFSRVLVRGVWFVLRVGRLGAVWLVGGRLGLAVLWLSCCLGFVVGCSAGLALGRLAGCACVCVCGVPPCIFTPSASRGSARSSRPARGNGGGREGGDRGLDADGREGGY